MNVVDSCGWLEYLADGPNAPFFAPAIEATGELLVPTVCILEVFRVASRQRGREAALAAVETLAAGKPVDLDTSIALMAARLGLERELPLADAVVYATARAREATLWTQDEHFGGLEGVEYRPAR